MPTCPLRNVPETHRKARDSVRRFNGVDDDTETWVAYVKNKAALIVVAQDQVYLVATGMGGVVTAMPFNKLDRIDAIGRAVQFRLESGSSFEISLESDDEATRFIEVVSSARRIWRDGEGQSAMFSGVAPTSAASRVLIVTMNEIPGYEIVAVHGDVFGIIVRARNMFSNMGASFRTISGGEVKGYTSLLRTSRNEARERLATHALEMGANAVVAMRFDCNEIADIMSEIAAYGTAVTIRPVAPALA
jgi:uncharacterized protein YbjQ (UPF0145 family)